MKLLFLIVLGFCCQKMAGFGQTESIASELASSDDGVRVSVLGYHDFSRSERETAMRINTEKFQKQMERLKESGIAVISMEDFIKWKDGEIDVPEKSVVITIDDGWKSVYTDAFPILKELNYPFTIYLYTNYVDGGGKALTTPMIEEMQKHGATIGSHSTSHPYPQEVKKMRKAGAETYEKFLQVEMGESRKYLRGKFGGSVETFAYPGGYFTEEMIEKADSLGYSHLFTVQPGKVNRSMPNQTLPRYIILGNYDRTFEFAIAFREDGNKGERFASGMSAEKLRFPVEPQPGAIINSRLPVISVDFTKMEDLDPASLRMRIGGFGEVPANYASEGKIFSWQVNRPLRQLSTTVEVSWKDKLGNATNQPLQWTFQIDREAAYMPDE